MNYELLRENAKNLAELLVRKNQAYGSAFQRAGEFLKLLYPGGVRPHDYQKMLVMARMFDKQMRIAHHADAFGEDPFLDLAGYGLLQATHQQDPRDQPLKVVLCGSTKFKPMFDHANKLFTLAGCIVLSVGYFGHLEQAPPTREEKEKLDALHLRKIEMADLVVILQQAGYVGESTKREIEHAKRCGKQIAYLNNTEELEACARALRPTIR